MGRGRSKQKVQQAFLQRKWLLGGYLTLWEKEEIHCKGGWPPRTARGLVGTTIARLAASLDLVAGLGQKPSGRNDAGPFHNGMELVDGKIRECVSVFRRAANFDASDFWRGCSTRNVNEVRSATNNCRRCGPHHFAPFPLR